MKKKKSPSNLVVQWCSMSGPANEDRMLSHLDDKGFWYDSVTRVRKHVTFAEVKRDLKTLEKRWSSEIRPRMGRLLKFWKSLTQGERAIIESQCAVVNGSHENPQWSFAYKSLMDKEWTEWVDSILDRVKSTKN